jgi:hypothetical protein
MNNNTLNPSPILPNPSRRGEGFGLLIGLGVLFCPRIGESFTNPSRAGVKDSDRRKARKYREKNTLSLSISKSFTFTCAHRMRARARGWGRIPVKDSRGETSCPTRMSEVPSGYKLIVPLLILIGNVCVRSHGSAQPNAPEQLLDRMTVKPTAKVFIGHHRTNANNTLCRNHVNDHLNPIPIRFDLKHSFSPLMYLAAHHELLDLYLARSRFRRRRIGTSPAN